jgi:hypothetical protein
VAEITSLLGGTVRQAENRSIWEGEKQELVGRSVFLWGVSGRLAVDSSAEAAGMRFSSAEEEVTRKLVGRLN